MLHGDRYGVAPLDVTCASGKRFAVFGIGEGLLSSVDWCPGER